MAEKTFKLTNERAKQLLADIRQVSAQDGDWRVTLDELEETFESIAEMTQEPERVIFRTFKHDGKVCAMLPDRLNDDGYIGFVDENGKYMVTAPHFGDTRPADEHEYRDLLNELRRQDYHNLKIVKGFGKLGRK